MEAPLIKDSPEKPEVKGSASLPANVLSVLKSINESAASKSDTAKPLLEKPRQKIPHKIPRGKAKSGRPWKTPKQKFSTIKKTIYRRSKEKKEALRDELKHIKDLSRSIKDDHKESNLKKKERREENAKRRLENERKSEIVQVIKNPAKLKRMKKKALRKIEKRDLNAVKVV